MPRFRPGLRHLPGRGGFDYGSGISVDGSGTAHVTGYTVSPDFPPRRVPSTRASTPAIMGTPSWLGWEWVVSTAGGGPEPVSHRRARSLQETRENDSGPWVVQGLDVAWAQSARRPLVTAYLFEERKRAQASLAPSRHAPERSPSRLPQVPHHSPLAQKCDVYRSICPSHPLFEFSPDLVQGGQPARPSDLDTQLLGHWLQIIEKFLTANNNLGGRLPNRVMAPMNRPGIWTHISSNDGSATRRSPPTMNPLVLSTISKW